MRFLLLLLALSSISGCVHSSPINPPQQNLRLPGENYFFNDVRQLTDSGENSEAYWSFDGRWLSFQHKDPQSNCYQIYKMKNDGKEAMKLSGESGYATCSFFFPNDRRIFFSSTRAYDSTCPPPPHLNSDFAWYLSPDYQFYSVKPDANDLIPIEPGGPRAYNAEARACHDGSVIFTSDRKGDLDLYHAKMDSFGLFTEIHAITHTLGYDGGASFSPDCSKIAWRASRPRKGKELANYKSLLAKHWIKPETLEIWIANSDGTHAHQVTQLDAVSSTPTFTPDGSQLLFSSNLKDVRKNEFNLYLINSNGTDLRTITTSQGIESFPMFSPDGKYLTWTSNRNSLEHSSKTHIFIAEWIAAKTGSQQVPTPFLQQPQKESMPADRFLDLTLNNPRFENIVSEKFASLGLKVRAEEEAGDSPDHSLKARPILSTWGQSCKKLKPIVISAGLSQNNDASSIAAAVEVARIVVSDPKSKQSCFVFIAFTNPSNNFEFQPVAALLQKLHFRPKAILNIHSVGTLENNTLMTSGTHSAIEWPELIEAECDKHHLSCIPTELSSPLLYPNPVPVLDFFTAPNNGPNDSGHYVNATGGVQAAAAIAAIAIQTSLRSQELHFRKAGEILQSKSIRDLRGEETQSIKSFH